MTLAVHRSPSIRSDEKGLGDEEEEEDLDGIFGMQDPRRWSHLGLAITSDVKSNGIRSPRMEKDDIFNTWTSRSRHLSATSSSSSATKCRSSHHHHNGKQDFSMRKGHELRMDEDGMSLDMALQYVGQDVFANENAVNMRRRGRAICLNDQLRFDCIKERDDFHQALLDWQDGLDDDQKILCHEGDCDPSILLALSRCLAMKEGHHNLDSPCATPATRAGQQQFHLPMRRKAASRVKHMELQTSASTPEGALGRLDLPEMGEMNDLVPEMEMLASPTEAESSEEAAFECEKGRKADLFQAALRYALSYLDDVETDKSKESSSNHYGGMRSRSSSLRQKVQVQHQQQETEQDQLQIPSRGQSIIKKLTMKRLSLNPSDRQISPSTSLSPTRSNTMSSEGPKRSSGIAILPSIATPLLSSNKDGTSDSLLLQQEKARTAALEKELETIREALRRQSVDIQKKNASTKDGDDKANESQMLLSIAQAARERAAAEEREATYQSQCEELQIRLETTEEALYNAIGLLAEKEEGSAIISTSGRRSPVGLPSDNDGDFYSAGEEEEGESSKHSRPEDATKTTNGLSNIQTEASADDADEDEVPFPGRFSMLSSSSIAVDPIDASPKAEDLESRRSSHASWIRHTILPSVPSKVPVPPVPDLTAKDVHKKQEPNHDTMKVSREESQEAKGIPTSAPVAKTSKMSDASSRERTSSRPRLRSKSNSVTSASEIDTLDSIWSIDRQGDDGSMTSDSRRDIYTPASSVDVPSIIDEELSPRWKGGSDAVVKTHATLEQRQTTTASAPDMIKERPKAKRAESHQSYGSCKSNKSEKRTGSNKHSIIGHMPPMPTMNRHRKSESGFSGASIRSDPSLAISEGNNEGIQSSLLDHYVNLHSDVNKDETRVKSFSRRTRFRQDAST